MHNTNRVTVSVYPLVINEQSGESSSLVALDSFRCSGGVICSSKGIVMHGGRYIVYSTLSVTVKPVYPLGIPWPCNSGCNKEGGLAKLNTGPNTCFGESGVH